MTIVFENAFSTLDPVPQQLKRLCQHCMEDHSTIVGASMIMTGQLQVACGKSLQCRVEVRSARFHAPGEKVTCILCSSPVNPAHKHVKYPNGNAHVHVSKPSA